MIVGAALSSPPSRGFRGTGPDVLFGGLTAVMSTAAMGRAWAACAIGSSAANGLTSLFPAPLIWIAAAVLWVIPHSALGRRHRRTALTAQKSSSPCGSPGSLPAAICSTASPTSRGTVARSRCGFFREPAEVRGISRKCPTLPGDGPLRSLEGDGRSGRCSPPCSGGSALHQSGARGQHPFLQPQPGGGRIRLRVPGNPGAHGHCYDLRPTQSASLHRRMELSG